MIVGALGPVLDLARRAASFAGYGPRACLHVDPTVWPGLRNGGAESENPTRDRQLGRMVAIPLTGARSVMAAI